MKRFLTLLLALIITVLPTANLTANAETKNDVVVTRYLSRASGLVDTTYLYLDKNTCLIDYLFVEQGTGSITTTLQKKNSSGVWIGVANGYSTYAFTSGASGSITVNSLSDGTYRVKSSLYMIKQGTEYWGTCYTGEKTLR